MSNQEKDDRLLISPLFVALTKPAMIMGVTLDYFGICAMIALCGFIVTSSALYLLLYIPLHILGVIGCMIDHNIFRLVMKKSECLPVENKSIWGCQSYEPF